MLRIMVTSSLLLENVDQHTNFPLNCFIDLGDKKVGKCLNPDNTIQEQHWEGASQRS